MSNDKVIQTDPSKDDFIAKAQCGCVFRSASYCDFRVEEGRPCEHDIKILFDEIEEARLPTKWPKSAEEEMALNLRLEKLVLIAQELGIYPAKTVDGNPNSVLTMVKGWGARWTQFRGHLECPHCYVDLRSPIGPPFKREIGIYDEDRDCTVDFRCPDCEKSIER
jgi:hypothetical protein